MTKEDLQPATIEDFAYWINERHSIYLKRMDGKTKPWTTDEILQRWKFTNVYRQLDTGTVWLRRMLNGDIKGSGLIDDPELIVFNVIWYRLFNRWEHARDLGFVQSYKKVENYITKCFRQGKKIFTGAYMTTGVSFEDKYVTYLQACKEIWDNKIHIVSLCKMNSMEVVFHKLLQHWMIGKFVAYELVCDLRFTKVLNPVDQNTWCNLGPGAVRGLKRLGMEPTVESARILLCGKGAYLQPHVFKCEWPFELREIEHSLCEFDKYQRVKTGVGRPRSKYDGV